jgi:hypothetical protein
MVPLYPKNKKTGLIIISTLYIIDLLENDKQKRYTIGSI